MQDPVVVTICRCGVKDMGMCPRGPDGIAKAGRAETRLTRCWPVRP